LTGSAFPQGSAIMNKDIPCPVKSERFYNTLHTLKGHGLLCCAANRTTQRISYTLRGAFFLCALHLNIFEQPLNWLGYCPSNFLARSWFTGRAIFLSLVSSHEIPEHYFPYCCFLIFQIHTTFQFVINKFSPDDKHRWTIHIYQFSPQYAEVPPNNEAKRFIVCFWNRALLLI